MIGTSACIIYSRRTLIRYGTCHSLSLPSSCIGSSRICTSSGRLTCLKCRSSRLCSFSCKRSTSCIRGRSVTLFRCTSRCVNSCSSTRTPTSSPIGVVYSHPSCIPRGIKNRSSRRVKLGRS